MGRQHVVPGAGARGRGAVTAAHIGRAIANVAPLITILSHGSATGGVAAASILFSSAFMDDQRDTTERFLPRYDAAGLGTARLTNADSVVPPHVDPLNKNELHKPPHS